MRFISIPIIKCSKCFQPYFQRINQELKEIEFKHPDNKIKCEDNGRLFKFPASTFSLEL